MDKKKICIIDFDGTFFRNDFFQELFFKKLISNPFFILHHFFIKQESIIDLKHNLLQNHHIKYDTEFLINKTVINWIHDNRSNYKKIILVSATPDFFLKRILQRINCFDEIYGSTNINLKGEAKLNFILENLDKNFDYIGNSKDDIPIYKESIKPLKITTKGLIYVNN